MHDPLDPERARLPQTEAVQFRSIRPALGRIVIQLLESEYMSKGGIYLPFGGEKITTAGRVVKTCDAYRSADDDTDKQAPFGPLYSMGDVVVFGKYVGSEVTIGTGKRAVKYIIMNESDIMGTLHEEEY